MDIQLEAFSRVFRLYAMLERSLKKTEEEEWEARNLTSLCDTLRKSASLKPACPALRPKSVTWPEPVPGVLQAMGGGVLEGSAGCAG